MAEPVGRRSLTPSLLLAAAMLVSIAACRRGAVEAHDVSVSWTAAAIPTVAAPILADIVLRDASRRPIRGARIQLQAFMSHPGMAPIVISAEERGDGVYRARLQFTMAGPWTIVVRGSLPDGRTVARTIDIPNVRPDDQ